MKALSFVAIVILLGAVLLGLSLSNTDLLNFHTRAAEARQIDVETALNQQVRQAELDRIREENNIKLEALRARLAKDADLREFAVLFGLAVFAVATLVLSVALAYYLVCRGNALRAGQPVATEKPSRRLLEFPSPDKRKRRQAPMSSHGWPDEAA